MTEEIKNQSFPKQSSGEKNQNVKEEPAQPELKNFQSQKTSTNESFPMDISKYTFRRKN